jgi:hypothetical protein
LLTIRGEVFRLEPTLKVSLDTWPLGIKHGEPGGIAIKRFNDHVLTKYSLKGKTKATSCPERRSGYRAAESSSPIKLVIINNS